MEQISCTFSKPFQYGCRSCHSHKGQFAALITGPKSADSILPWLIWVIIRTNPPRLVSSLALVERYRRPEALRDGRTDYCLTNMKAAISYIHEVQILGDGMDDSSYGSGIKPPASPPASPHQQSDSIFVKLRDVWKKSVQRAKRDSRTMAGQSPVGLGRSLLIPPQMGGIGGGIAVSPGTVPAVMESAASFVSENAQQVAAAATATGKRAFDLIRTPGRYLSSMVSRKELGDSALSPTGTSASGILGVSEVVPEAGRSLLHGDPDSPRTRATSHAGVRGLLARGVSTPSAHVDGTPAISVPSTDRHAESDPGTRPRGASGAEARLRERELRTISTGSNASDNEGMAFSTPMTGTMDRMDAQRRGTPVNSNECIGEAPTISFADKRFDELRGWRTREYV